ncbi:tetraspanin-33 isoform X1 [Cuculus canorus]|uniref:tetraspanin-33 isoform X1 n=1 Tax=Cuculus canorus TaxID=55661 RepID=UPI0023AABDB3|nr:tetraspanin-33 isoform X1 [Cuculus canorus]
MARRAAGSAGAHGDDFSFVSPAVKYVLFFFNTLFWAISMVMMAVGVYARLLKHAEAAMACLAVDPAVLLIVVGILTFLITFCGCVGSLRENICLLQVVSARSPALQDLGFSAMVPPSSLPSPSSYSQFSGCLTIIFLLQLAAGVLGFVFSDKVRMARGQYGSQPVPLSDVLSIVPVVPKARGKVSEIINGAIVHYRDDLDLQNLIDFGQKEFSCCGGVSYKDWSQNMYFNCTAANPSRERCSVPFSCCLQDPDEAVVNTMCGQGMQARSYLEASAFIYTNGCIDTLVNWVHSNLFLLGGVALGLAVPQLVGILLAQILVSQIRDQIRLQLYTQQHRADPWY